MIHSPIHTIHEPTGLPSSETSISPWAAVNLGHEGMIGVAHLVVRTRLTWMISNQRLPRAIRRLAASAHMGPSGCRQFWTEGSQRCWLMVVPLPWVNDGLPNEIQMGHSQIHLKTEVAGSSSKEQLILFLGSSLGVHTQPYFESLLDTTVYGYIIQTFRDYIYDCGRKFNK